MSIVEALEAFSARITPSDFVAFSSSLFGAFFGAYCAYLLARKSEKEAKEDARFDACTKLQYTLITYLNFLQNIRIQHLEEYRADPDRAFKLTLFFFDPPAERINFDSLSFLLMGKDPSIVQDINVIERKVMAVSSALGLRNEELKTFYTKHEQDYQRMNIKTGAGPVIATPPEIKMLNDLTDTLYHGIDSSIAATETLSEKVYQAVKERFPKRKFIKIKN